MAANILKLKKDAVKAGMPKAEAMKATRPTLEAFLSEAASGGSKKKVPAKKKAAPAKKKATKNSTPAAKKSAPGAKKSATPKKAGKPKRQTSQDGGRNMVGSLDFSVTEGWNPREGSPVAVIFKALKKNRGNVAKTVEQLLPNVKDFVSSKKKDGTKRDKQEMRNQLLYRVNRTRWEFARRTGQHDPSENRVEYGTGPYAQANKPKKRSTPKRSKPNTAAKRTPAKKKAKKR